MSKPRKDLTDSRFYPVLFMILVTVIFIGVLSTFYHVTENKVNLYRENSIKRIMLELFDLPSENISDSYRDHIIEVSVANYSYTYYQAIQDSTLLGYCFPVSGSGLWGTISALLAVTPDLKEIIALEIVSQNETPGLGGRITEDWFKDQFRHKQIISNDRIREFNLVPESELAGTTEVRQITGASQSSKAVTSILFREMKRIVSLMGYDYE